MQEEYDKLTSWDNRHNGGVEKVADNDGIYADRYIYLVESDMEYTLENLTKLRSISEDGGMYEAYGYKDGIRYSNNHSGLYDDTLAVDTYITPNGNKMEWCYVIEGGARLEGSAEDLIQDENDPSFVTISDKEVYDKRAVEASKSIAEIHKAVAEKKAVSQEKKAPTPKRMRL